MSWLTTIFSEMIYVWVACLLSWPFITSYVTHRSPSRFTDRRREVCGTCPDVGLWCRAQSLACVLGLATSGGLWDLLLILRVDLLNQFPLSLPLWLFSSNQIRLCYWPLTDLWMNAGNSHLISLQQWHAFIRSIRHHGRSEEWTDRREKRKDGIVKWSERWE